MQSKILKERSISLRNVTREVLEGKIETISTNWRDIFDAASRMAQYAAKIAELTQKAGGKNNRHFRS